MPYALLADLVVLLHVSFVLFVLCGGVLVLRWPWLARLHLPAALWGVTIELGGWVCPLTYLENSLRRLGGESGYAGTFIQQYLEPLLYPLGLGRNTQFLFALIAFSLNLAIYARLWIQHRRKKQNH